MRSRGRCPRRGRSRCSRQGPHHGGHGSVGTVAVIAPTGRYGPHRGHTQNRQHRHGCTQSPTCPPSPLPWAPGCERSPMGPARFVWRLRRRRHAFKPPPTLAPARYPADFHHAPKPAVAAGATRASVRRQEAALGRRAGGARSGRAPLRRRGLRRRSDRGKGPAGCPARPSTSAAAAGLLVPKRSVTSELDAVEVLRPAADLQRTAPVAPHQRALHRHPDTLVRQRRPPPPLRRLLRHTVRLGSPAGDVVRPWEDRPGINPEHEDRRSDGPGDPIRRGPGRQFAARRTPGCCRPQWRFCAYCRWPAAVRADRRGCRPSAVLPPCHRRHRGKIAPWRRELTSPRASSCRAAWATPA